MNLNKDIVNQNLKKAELAKKYRTLEPGIEINNNYYTFTTLDDNEHIAICKSSSNTMEISTEVIGVTTKTILKDIIDKLNIK